MHNKIVHQILTAVHYPRRFPHVSAICTAEIFGRPKQRGGRTESGGRREMRGLRVFVLKHVAVVSP